MILSVYSRGCERRPKGMLVSMSERDERLECERERERKDHVDEVQGGREGIGGGHTKTFLTSRLDMSKSAKA